MAIGYLLPLAAQATRIGPAATDLPPRDPSNYRTEATDQRAHDSRKGGRGQA